MLMRQRPVLIVCTLLLSIFTITATARPQSPTSLKFDIKVVDPITGKPKSTFILGETVSVVFTVTNVGRRAQTIPLLPETYFPLKLVSVFEHEDPQTVERAVGGTAGAYVRPDGSVYWTEREPRWMMLRPGRSVSMRMDDLRGRYDDRLKDGKHTLSATYLVKMKAAVSFRIVIDAAKSIALLEEIAEAAPRNGNESDGSWARQQLEKIRLPSLSGMVTDTAGRPLKEVEISVTGPQELEYETRSNGRYHIDELDRGAAYTLTPSLTRDGNFEATYTFEPASRTVTSLNSKLTDLNFVATKVRPSINLAEDSEGATAKASSTQYAPNDKFSADMANDGVSSDDWDQCCNGTWSDGTPNVFPDWLEIDFKSPKAIDWINVFTIQDDPANEPTLTEKFTKDGITDYDVQYWNGGIWKNVPGGAIRKNRNVWRKIEFPTITTNKIRVVVRRSLSGYSRIMEVEAFHVNRAPVVKLAGPTKGRTNSNFQFHTKVSDRDQSIYKYILNFGDGTPPYEMEYGNKPAIKELNLTHTHTYPKPGIYEVTLRAFDHDFEGSETTMTVKVTDLPKPAFAEGKTVVNGVVGEVMTFQGRESSGPDEKGVSYYWDFDDGTLGTGRTISHRFAAPGTYMVIVTVEDTDGQRMRYMVHARITATASGKRE
jgi:hypothetical protein